MWFVVIFLKDSFLLFFNYVSVLGMYVSVYEHSAYGDQKRT